MISKFLDEFSKCSISGKKFKSFVKKVIIISSIWLFEIIISSFIYFYINRSGKLFFLISFINLISFIFILINYKKYKTEEKRTYTMERKNIIKLLNKYNLNSKKKIDRILLILDEYERHDKFLNEKDIIFNNKMDKPISLILIPIGIGIIAEILNFSENNWYLLLLILIILFVIYIIYKIIYDYISILCSYKNYDLSGRLYIILNDIYVEKML